jgi:hypothetical protein
VLGLHPGKVDRLKQFEAAQLIGINPPPLEENPQNIILVEFFIFTLFQPSLSVARSNQVGLC